MFASSARRPALRLVATASAATATLLGLTGPANAGGPAAAPVGIITGAGSAAIPGSYIVVLKPGSAAAGRVTSASQELVRAYGGTVAGSYLSTVRGFHLEATATEAGRLAADPAVDYVEQDAMIVGAAAQISGAQISGAQISAAQISAPQISAPQMSAARSSATQVPWGLNRIAQTAPALSRGYRYRSATNVTVYVIDTGVRVSHREFGGRARNGWDFVDGDRTADDCNGHGTHVAGIVGGATYGVAKDVRLVALKVLNCAGAGKYSNFIAAVDWVTANAKLPAVANMSIGGPVSKALDAAVNRSIAKGVTYSIAAGNEHRNACGYSPADTPNAITVGSVDSKDARSSFSNYGTCLDLFAPGSRIPSAGKGSDSATKTMSGTSMASPHVAGAAALVLGAHPRWTPRQVRDDLVGHAGTGLIRNAGAGSPNRMLHTGHLTAGR